MWSGGGVSSVESESESLGRGRAVKGHIGYKNTPRRKPVARRSDQRRAASGRCARTASPPTPPQPLSDRRTTLRTTPRGRRPRHTSNRSSPKQSARSATQAPRRTTTRIFCDVTASGSGHCPGCPGRDRTLSRLGPAGTGWGCRTRDCVPGQRNTAGTLSRSMKFKVRIYAGVDGRRSLAPL